MTYSVSSARSGLWSRGFGWLLGGQTVSTVGSQVTFVALPLIAATSLHASPAAMGLLAAVDNLPYLLVGLFVGVWVDRRSRRGLMIAADVLRAIAVVSLPVTFALGHVTFVQLCVVAFAVGVGNIVFDVACQANLPDVVPADRLVEANGALQTTAGLATVAAPGLAGLLIRALGAPLAVIVDAVSYLVSLLTLWALPRGERVHAPADGSSWRQVVDGLATVRHDSRLVGLAGGAATVSLAMNLVMAVLVYDLSTIRHLTAFLVGLAFLTFGLGGAVGAGLGTVAGKRAGAGRTLALGPVVGAAGLALTALSGRPGLDSIPLLYAGTALAGVGLMGHQVVTAGLRQALAPKAARGRVIGTLRFLEWGVMPLGALLGGALGQLLGTPATLGVGAALVALASTWVLVTPLRATRLGASADTPNPKDDLR